MTRGKRLRRADPEAQLARRPVVELGTPTGLISYLTPYLAGVDREETHVICLGDTNEVLEHARFPMDAERTVQQVVSTTLAIKGTAKIVLAQCWPRGSPVPKAWERQVRTDAARVLRLMGLPTLYDHIVFGRQSSWSFRANRTFPFWEMQSSRHA